jgi:hypothetical protein
VNRRKSERVEGEEKLSGYLRQPDYSDKLQQKKIHLASRRPGTSAPIILGRAWQVELVVLPAE